MPPLLARCRRFTRKLKKVTAEQGARFVSYDPAPGTWKFEVEHFSKYGLLDSDDDEDEAGGEAGGGADRRTQQQQQQRRRQQRGGAAGEESSDEDLQGFGVGARRRGSGAGSGPAAAGAGADGQAAACEARQTTGGMGEEEMDEEDAMQDSKLGGAAGMRARARARPDLVNTCM